MTVDELRKAMESSEPIAIAQDGTPLSKDEADPQPEAGQPADQVGTRVKPQVWSKAA